MNSYKTIGKYKLDKYANIGSGSSSKVYEGYLISNKDQKVAIKVIDMKKLKDEKKKEMIDNETALLQNLKHPNIIELYDIYNVFLVIFL